MKFMQMDSLRSTGRKLRKRMRLQDERPEDLKKRDESLSLGLTMKAKVQISVGSSQRRSSKRKKVRRTLMRIWLRNKKKLRERRSLKRKKKKRESRKRKNERQDLILSNILQMLSEKSPISSTVARKEQTPLLRLSNYPNRSIQCLSILIMSILSSFV